VGDAQDRFIRSSKRRKRGFLKPLCLKKDYRGDRQEFHAIIIVLKKNHDVRD
jgi:hypothetical protein